MTKFINCINPKEFILILRYQFSRTFTITYIEHKIHMIIDFFFLILNLKEKPEPAINIQRSSYTPGFP